MDMKQLVKRSGKTRRNICEEAGISRALLSLLESGQRQIGLQKLESLSIALGAKPFELRPDLAAIFEVYAAPADGVKK